MILDSYKVLQGTENWFKKTKTHDTSSVGPPKYDAL